MGLFNGFRSLGANINKADDTIRQESEEGVSSALIDELSLDMPDTELIDLSKDWEKAWSKEKSEIEKKGDLNEQYWLGNHFGTSAKNGLTDNRIFSSFETFLPIATRQRPEPVVIDPSPIKVDDGLPESVNAMLKYQVDIQAFRLKLKSVMRHWGLYYLGVMKFGWNMAEDDISSEVVRMQRLILDPDATIDEQGFYHGERIGHVRSDTAQTLIERFADGDQELEDEISEMVNGKLGTKLQYTEWWTPGFVFWRLKDTILDKSRNPHWNYDGFETKTDEFGNEEEVPVRGSNHFNSPRMPFIFFSVFNLGRKPYDETSLIEQNISMQDLINKRIRQIDKNVDGMNGGWAISGERSGMTKDEATRAIEATRKGGGMYISSGDVREAAQRMTAEPLPGDVFNQLRDSRNELDNIFGTHATTRGERTGPETASGRILLKDQDIGRIGNISDYLEQFSDHAFNWWVQLMYVYYTEERVAAIIGPEMATKYTTLRAENLNRKLVVSVKEGSMRPVDESTTRAEAMELWNSNALDPITLFERLDFPNPRETAKNAYLWQSDPAALFPELAEEAARKEAEEAGEPPETEEETQINALLDRAGTT